MSESEFVTTHQTSIDEGKLLVSREHAREMLGGISVTQLRRLMDAGDISPVDLTTSKNPIRRGKLYFRVSDLIAFVDRRANRNPSL